MAVTLTDFCSKKYHRCVYGQCHCGLKNLVLEIEKVIETSTDIFYQHSHRAHKRAIKTVNNCLIGASDCVKGNIYCEIIYVPCSCAGGKRTIVVGTTHIIRIVRSYLLSTC